MHKNIHIFENDIDHADIDTINELMLQLTASAAALDLEAIQKVMDSGFILTARDTSPEHLAKNPKGTIIGMASLIPVRKLFAHFGTVEDVIVHEKYRGLGLGKKLAHHTIEKAKKHGLKYLDLTSNPSREAANKLYQSVGFEKRDTNVYRLKF